MAASQPEMKKRLKVLMNRPENQVCSDCPERQPRWASLIKIPDSPPGSLPIGAFCCLECSGSHRRLGVHISFVRSVNLDSWKEKEVLAMENGGNRKVNAIFEARLGNSGAKKPTTAADGPTRERFIRDKYERRKYYDASVLETYVPDEVDEPAAPSTKRKVVRHPSEAARLRAESRKGRGGQVEAPRTVQPSMDPPAAAAPAAQVDLLDFAAFDTPAATPAPAAAPPPATPTSPALDLFADMSVSGSAPPPAARTTNDQILAMFNTSSQPSPMQPSAVAMATPNGGMMMASGMPNNMNPMMMQPNNMNGFGNMGQAMMQNAQPNTMLMQQQGNSMLMQQQGNNMLMMQKNQAGNMMMMQNTMQQPAADMSMLMMQQASNSDGFGFPQAPMGSGPTMMQQQQLQQPNGFGPMGGMTQNGGAQATSNDDPFSQFGMNVFR